MNRKPGLWIAVLLPLFIVAGCGDNKGETKTVIRPVRAIQLSDVSVLFNDVYPGRAKATQEVDLSFRVSGPLIELPVDIGDEVKAGQVLARIDPRDFEVALQNTKGQLSRARAAFTRAEKDYNRFLAIQKKNPGFISQSRIDMARAMRDEASANISSLAATVKNADDRLRDTYLKASFDGTVVAKYVENHEYVNARLPIIRVLDSSQIEMIVNVPESKISLSPYVKGISVRFDAFPRREIAAKIKEIGTEASKTTRTYPVTLIMDQPDDIEILPGMAGNAYPKVIKQSASGEDITLTIPATAVFSPADDGKSYVWRIDPENNTVSRRPVTLGNLTNTGIPVIDGIKAGDWIVTAGVSYLREGQQIKILDEEN